jgi:hypothetical protein
MVASPPADPHSLATASGLLLGTLGATMAAGALLGWMFGSGGLGLLIVAVLVVYKVYSSRS